MHYIPFLSEKPTNRYDDVDCRNCPCFEGSIIYDKILEGTCRFNRGQKEKFDLDLTERVQLQGATYHDCPCKYKDPVENFHYYQFMSILANSLVNTMKSRMEKEKLGTLSDEEADKLLNKCNKIVEVSRGLKDLYPQFEDLYIKITQEGYVLDEDMKPYKL